MLQQGQYHELEKKYTEISILMINKINNEVQDDTMIKPSLDMCQIDRLITVDMID